MSGRPRPSNSSSGSSPASRSNGDERRRRRNEGSEGSQRRERERERRDPKLVGPWKVGKTIGKGSSGRVRLAKHTLTKQMAAIKIVPKARPEDLQGDPDDPTQKALLGIEREIVIMKLIEHPNVLRLMDVWETDRELFLIMELAEGGELFDYLVAKGRLHADEALHYFQQIISGVDYCHRFNICHRDLKPENLLLDKDKNIKIADFGMAALQRMDRLLETSCGSPHYASPEVVAGLTYHGSSSDIWSCGVILYALLTGRLPFEHENITELLQKVKRGVFYMPTELPPDARDLISRMLKVKPEKRITMAEIQVHSWMTRRPPRAIRGAPPYVPPSISQIEHPVASREEIDPEILGNLRTLWNGAPENVIIDALLSPDKSWEKVFYTLLYKYRTRNLENFNMDEDEMAEHVKKAKSPEKSRQHVVTSGVIASRSRRSRQSLSNLASVSGSKRSKPASPPSTAIPSPPLPPPVVTQVASLPPPPTVQYAYSPRGPRPLPQVPGSPPPTSAARRVPEIHLQEATPDAHISYTASREVWRSAPPPSPTPSSVMPFDPSGPPVLPLTIPETADAATQQFFHALVAQLHNISGRNSIPVSAPSSPAATYLQAVPDLFSAGTTPVLEADQDQFEDAEDDESEVGTPLPGAFGSPYPGEHQEAYVRKPPAPPHLSRPPLVRPRIAAPRGSSREHVVGDGRRNSLTEQYVIVERPEVGKENYRHGRAPPPRPGKSQKRVTLGLAIQSSGVPVFEDDMLSPISPKLQKRRKPLSIGGSPASPAMSGFSEPPSPKPSWLTNLFNWKSLNYTLQSTENVPSTREACVELLTRCGVDVEIESNDGTPFLKCRVANLRDVSSASPLKGVKFRVEFSAHASPASSPIVGLSPDLRGHYPTGVTLMMEKGAHSTFKVVYNRLRAFWELDNPRFPNQGLAVRLIPSPVPSPGLASPASLWS